MERLILIIDPQNAFCREDGSLANAFGTNELSRISECLIALESLLKAHSTPNEFLLIRSQYRPGQFTGSDLGYPYAKACVPGNKQDCGWSLSEDALAQKRVVTKFEESAISAPGLLKELRDLVGGGLLNQVLVAGFLTTSCVLKTALDLRRELPKSVEVGVLKDFTASRASNYVASGNKASRHEAALNEMQTTGIHIIHGFSIPAHGDKFVG
jgi:nicotinamidase-related amidase